MYDPKEHGKEIIRFGNWVVTSRGIVWGGELPRDYVLDKDSLWDDRGGMWDWLVHLPEKTWLNEVDILQLNSAFFFALDYHKDAKPAGAVEKSTWETLKEQQVEMKHR